MLAYVMVGSANLKRSAKFYDAVMDALGYIRTETEKSYIGYGTKRAPDQTVFYITRPYNRRKASVGNGTMITLKARSRKALDAFHAAALANGGTNEGKPGPRLDGDPTCYAYARDPDGNKICACSP
ncbi:MAG: glyoxalase [Rhodospirillaceae bacterium]|nr:glyoxalase [Rhodospirillaceae bacterium]|tara:strand:- start:474 stop:851 length:378 start_codon:yes stop_codon:yes gene_type:complete